MKSGTADLPLHYGRVPRWLAERMALLGREITRIMVEERGPSEFLSRLSDPFWFQALGCVMGMDWHSSGNYNFCYGSPEKGAEFPFPVNWVFIFAAAVAATSRMTPDEIC